jgi:hypothetical protein
LIKTRYEEFLEEALKDTSINQWAHHHTGAQIDMNKSYLNDSNCSFNDSSVNFYNANTLYKNRKSEMKK